MEYTVIGQSGHDTELRNNVCAPSGFGFFGPISEVHMGSLEEEKELRQDG